MKFTEENLRLYAAPLSDSEDQRCKNAIGMVRDALKDLGYSDEGKSIRKMYEETYSYSLEMNNIFKNRRVKIFVQGSYANNTNVRTKSDVDIAVVLESTFIPKYRPGISGAFYGFSHSTDDIKTFKDEVEEALRKKFGKDVERKNKSIKIHGNSYRVDADSVPCMRYRDYSNEYYGNPYNFIGGIYIKTDDGQIIVNYPEQHIKNGREKNNQTRTYYKKMVRIIKRIRYIMEDLGYESAKNVSSFGLESLLWNLPNDLFTKYTTYKYVFGDITDYLVKNINMLVFYKEANGIKPLCSSPSQIQYYTKFINDLFLFYEYDI